MKSLALRHYLPINKERLILQFCQSELLNRFEPQQFELLCAKLEKYFHLEFFSVTEKLKSAYAPMDPDNDQDPSQLLAHHRSLGPMLESLLKRANYFKLEQEQILASLTQASLFKIRLHVNFDDFEEVVVYCCGESHRTEVVRRWLFWRRSITFLNYDRVVLFLRLKMQAVEDATRAEFGRQGFAVLKLFKNVPQGDLEMLFPNTKIGMRLWDKLLIGIPAFVSGVAVVATKLSAPLVLLVGLVGFWLGYSARPHSVDTAALVAMLTGFLAVGGYIWKQFSNFKTRKLKFAQALTQNLYFKSLDSNAGVFFRVINDAEEQEFKEAAIAFFILSTAGRPLSLKALDIACEKWIALHFDLQLDFDAVDALEKLCRLGLAKQKNDLWYACTLLEALTKMDENQQQIYASV